MLNLWLFPGRAALALGGSSGRDPGAGSPGVAGRGGGSGSLRGGHCDFTSLFLIFDHHQILGHLLKLVHQPLPFHFGKDASLVVVSGEQRAGSRVLAKNTPLSRAAPSRRLAGEPDRSPRARKGIR